MGEEHPGTPTMADNHRDAILAFIADNVAETSVAAVVKQFKITKAEAEDMWSEATSARHVFEIVSRSLVVVTQFACYRYLRRRKRGDLSTGTKTDSDASAQLAPVRSTRGRKSLSKADSTGEGGSAADSSAADVAMSQLSTIPESQDAESEKSSAVKKTPAKGRKRQAGESIGQQDDEAAPATEQEALPTATPKMVKKGKVSKDVGEVASQEVPVPASQQLSAPAIPPRTSTRRQSRLSQPVDVLEELAPPISALAPVTPAVAPAATPATQCQPTSIESVTKANAAATAANKSPNVRFAPPPSTPLLSTLSMHLSPPTGAGKAASPVVASLSQGSKDVQPVKGILKSPSVEHVSSPGLSTAAMPPPLPPSSVHHAPVADGTAAETGAGKGEGKKPKKSHGASLNPAARVMKGQLYSVLQSIEQRGGVSVTRHADFRAPQSGAVIPDEFRIFGDRVGAPVLAAPAAQPKSVLHHKPGYIASVKGSNKHSNKKPVTILGAFPQFISMVFMFLLL